MTIMLDNREDVLLRPLPTVAPFSVYRDVSPVRKRLFRRPVLVSDTYRVWELVGDFGSLNVKLFETLIDAKASYPRDAVDVYDNRTESWIGDHPSLGRAK